MHLRGRCKRLTGADPAISAFSKTDLLRTPRGASILDVIDCCHRSSVMVISEIGLRYRKSGGGSFFARPACRRGVLSGAVWHRRICVAGHRRSIHGPLSPALPPGAPQAAAAALRAAAPRLKDDKAFTEDAMKSIGYAPDYATGPDNNRQARLTLTARPELDFGQKIEWVAMVKGAKYGAFQFLSCHGQAETVTQFPAVSAYPAR